MPITDVIMVNMVYFAAYYATIFLGKSISSEIIQNHIVVCNLIWLVSTATFGLYRLYGTTSLEDIYRGTLRSVALHFVLYALYLLFSKDEDFSRTFILIFYGLLSIGFIFNRFIGTSFQYLMINRFKGAKKVAVMGSNNTAIRLSSYLQNHRSLEFCGSVGDDDSIYTEPGVPVPASVSRKIAEAARQGVKDIYVAVSPQRMSQVKALEEEADRQCVRLKFVPDIGVTVASPYMLQYLGTEFPVLTLRQEPLEDVGSRFKKRVFDLAFSSLVILFVLSWLYPILAILIKLQSPGPVLFKQLRSGRNDEPFWCYKFRSMKINNDSDKKQASKSDDRITPIGRFLRKSSLDEMPQFFNVFLGNMSVVGPRPHMLNHTNEYKQIIDNYMVRHFLKPGITGWAQVHGFRGETRRQEDMENRVKYDINYLENWNSMLDVKIVFMTVINMMRGEDNAY
jgi:putative colanic acid biosynthesis UDP-glucose lipid carrier transferase